ncbi:DUF3883 domain-containing protein [Lysinibacillus xylanilyticus]|uniref:protein NO VEIN domain-containing protein n=1 Tax=Lysinibacillus TaxID=400634 RepID=UPI002B24E0A1|nr:DUF3883 domain-containing protein [Lysinibacillus xylanilyticus]MEB2279012.1 DUF3883 domain-containing protein [Lysinibacillus xylanilyticus]UNT56867.1 DUF3883 domain-containing protein [Lysinibacillus capsici]
MIKVYELNLPYIKVKENFDTINDTESVIGPFIGEIEYKEIDKITQESLETQFNEFSNFNEEDNNWLDENKQVGEIGELIAEAYLKSKYKNVKIVSDNAKLGYDIEVIENQKKLQFEVKTAQNHFGFHITKNELINAVKYSDTYNIFFIKLNEEDKRNIIIDGYIINNPIQLFGIDVTDLLTISSTTTITYQANNFFIRLIPSKLGKKIDLTFLI